MTGGLSIWDRDQRGDAAKAAVEYAEHGWWVVPGATWTGSQYVVPGTNRVLTGPLPYVPRDRATSDVRTVRRWWTHDLKQSPAVLLRAGEVFNLVLISESLARYVIATALFRSQPGPVLFRPDTRRAGFVVEPGLIFGSTFPRENFSAPSGEVMAMSPGDVIVAPPSLVPNGRVEWWINPRKVEWSPCELSVLMDSIILACRQRRDMSSNANRNVRG